MSEWMDFNRDGKVDGYEQMMGEEMLCGSKEEHEALFGDTGDYPTHQAGEVACLPSVQFSV